MLCKIRPYPGAKRNRSKTSWALRSRFREKAAIAHGDSCGLRSSRGVPLHGERGSRLDASQDVRLMQLVMRL
jgi:hypothetical protein